MKKRVKIGISIFLFFLLAAIVIFLLLPWTICWPYRLTENQPCKTSAAHCPPSGEDRCLATKFYLPTFESVELKGEKINKDPIMIEDAKKQCLTNPECVAITNTNDKNSASMIKKPVTGFKSTQGVYTSVAMC